VDFPISNNTLNQQFELLLNGQLATMVYRILEGKIYLMQTKVPEQLKGKGIATALVEHALEYAKKEKLKVVVYCAFTKEYLKKKKT
jgi:hypothetical protein